MPMPTSDPTARLQQTLESIAGSARRHGRAPGEIGLIAVSKTHPAASIRALAAAGQRRFGENYLQEALRKQAELADLELEWHFIGPLQSNKTRDVAACFHWVHTIDRLKIARRLSDQRPPELPPLNICIQINIDGEATKAGIALDDLPSLASEIAALPRLCLRGLMAIPAPSTDFAEQRRPCQRLRQALVSLQQQGLELDTLSMGMSGDMDAAIAEGATLVRVGTAIFGPRPAN